jgi:hypothetical protein
VSELWPWLVVFGLGIFHGINPAMGWLFAVALGLQEQKRAAVFRALPPMVLGHALSIGIIIAAVMLARVSLPHRALKISAAAILFAFGFYRLLRSRHPTWVGMRVGFGDLHHHGDHHAAAFANFSAPSLLAGSVGVHTLGYLLTTALLAILVYEKLGVAILRRAWFNIDLVWMLALMLTGAFILFV